MPVRTRYGQGLRHGIPIALGYLPVSFAFGISAVSGGLTVWEAILISMTNLTSSGQVAGLSLMLANASIIEMIITQLIINIRYSLMSLSLSQKMHKSVSTADRFLISFFNTDEIFAVASQSGEVGTKYMLGLGTLPYLGWSGGTLLGAVAGEILPTAISSALGLAIYGMFIAIVVPAAKRSRPVLMVAVVSASLSIIIKYFIPALSSGFSIIICALVASMLGAFLFPVKEEAEE